MSRNFADICTCSRTRYTLRMTFPGLLGVLLHKLRLTNQEMEVDAPGNKKTEHRP